MVQPSFEQSLQQEQMLYRLCNRIRQSLELQEILSTAVEEIRAFLNLDRVKIYRFESDGSGAVIAESIAEQRLPPYWAYTSPPAIFLTLPMHCFLKPASESLLM
jgi:light-regulated signal transduction histidine kinase (bacteriophytochrome)